MTNITVGDVVQLKSGSHKMTVSQISEADGEARCEWQTGDGKPNEKWYAFAALEVVPLRGTINPSAV